MECTELGHVFDHTKNEDKVICQCGKEIIHCKTCNECGYKMWKRRK